METSSVKIAKVVDQVLNMHLAAMTIAGRKETKLGFLNQAVVDRINKTKPAKRNRRKQ